MNLTAKPFLICAVLVFTAGATAAPNQPSPETYIVSTQVYFSPNGGSQDAVVKEINNAKKSIFVQAYSFTNQPIAKALVEAQKRGVSVYVILDKSNQTAKYSAADFTDHFGVDTYIDDKHAIAHNKIIIIDKETVITGSYNFTKAAENSNAENLLVIRSTQLADSYLGNWAEHQKHSIPYVGRDR